MDGMPIEEFFLNTVSNIEANEQLREPQREAHRSLREHFSESGEHALLQLPVGCGKTGVIATAPFGIAAGRVLVIAPNTTIRNGVAEALDINSPKCFWAKTRSLESVTTGPFRAVLDGTDANIHDCTESHFVVTNIQQLAGAADRWLPQFDADLFDMIIVDEGHHNVAPSWMKVFDHFPQAKVISLTATPFRSDGKRPEGKLIYKYPFHSAMRNGYIKQLDAVNAAPSEIFFTYRDDDHHHTLEEVLELREESWFRRGVALSPECNRHIVDASITRWRRMRAQTGIQHQIIAAACSVDHARQVRSLYEERDVRASEIYGEMPPEDKDRVFEDLKRGRIDCVVQVQMLGEGFDHPLLSIGAIFRPFRSVSTYIQFVGRVMRVIHEGQAGHPDNQGYVISHVGLNNDARWADFRELDFDDQAMIQEWVTKEAGAQEADTDESGGEPRRFDEGMLVQNEIISHFIENPYLDPEDDRVIEAFLKQPIQGTGLTVGDVTNKDALRQILQAEVAKRQLQPTTVTPQPQEQRRAARKRLSERSNSVVNRILKDLGLAREGWQISSAIGEAGGANLQALTAMLNSEINAFLGIDSGKRGKLEAAQVEAALAELDAIGDRVRDRIRDAMGDDG